MSANQDPRASSHEYLELNRLPEIMEGLLSELMFLKPADPKQHIIAALEKIKVAGSKPLLTVQDLDTLYGVFDVTKRGCVTEQQACNALRTVLGSRAPQPGPNAAATPMGREAFVGFCRQALCTATPLCKPGSSEASGVGAD